MDGWLDLREAHAMRCPLATHPGPPDDPLLLYSTSGTTSRPKLVERTQASYPGGHLATMSWPASAPMTSTWTSRPKTDKSRRTVPLPRSAIETLRAHRTRQLEEQRTAARAWQEHGLAFTTEIGTPLEPRNALRRFEALAERAGLRGVTLHTLRHSAASFLLAAGTHTKVVQEHLGHSSYAITADIYSYVGPAQQREAADRLDQALR